jgi:hypothetical protein
VHASGSADGCAHPVLRGAHAPSPSSSPATFSNTRAIFQKNKNKQQATAVAPLGATGKYTAVLTDGADTLDAVLSTEVSWRRDGERGREGGRRCSLPLFSPLARTSHRPHQPLPLKQKTSQKASKLVESGALASGSTLRLTAYSVSALSGGTKAVVTACDVLPASPGGGATNENVQPPATTPAPPARTAGAVAPAAGPTPPTATPAASHRPSLPIAALNPYTPAWTLRAWVERRAPKRTTAGGLSVFSAELVDEAGDAIEATFWREAADRWDPVLKEKGCYYFAKGKVKPASKAYAATRNPYALDFGVGSVIEEAPVGSGGLAGPAATPTARLSYVPLSGLAPHIGRKAPVDVLGFLLAVGPLGSVKRKSDSAELARRDLTLGDASGKSVVLTLWGGAAEGAGAEAEAKAAAAAAAGGPPPLISVSHCRVSDFNGVSVSALARSAVALDPTGQAADDLRAWWAAEGSKLGGGGAGFVPAGEGMGRAGGAGSGTGPKPRAVLADLAAKPGEALPPPSAKPEYHTVVATVTMVDPEQVRGFVFFFHGFLSRQTLFPVFFPSHPQLTHPVSPLSLAFHLTLPPFTDHVVRRRPGRPQPQSHPPRRRVVVRVRRDAAPVHDAPVRPASPRRRRQRGGDGGPV